MQFERSSTPIQEGTDMIVEPIGEKRPSNVTRTRVELRAPGNDLPASDPPDIPRQRSGVFSGWRS